MQRAGLAAWSTLRRHWPQAQRLTVVCGPGNNGGDGYVLASAARQALREVWLLEVGDATRLGPDAAECRREALALGAVLGRERWHGWLVERRALGPAALYAGLSVVLATSAVFLGLLVMRRVLA